MGLYGFMTVFRQPQPQKQIIMEEKKLNNNESGRIDDCFISKRTWEFLSCVLALYSMYDKVSEALVKMYGEQQANEIIKKDFDRKYKEVESILYGFANDSISENISVLHFNTI